MVKGTLNDWKDKDKGWTAEMAVPIADLTRFGDVFGGESKWRILISRYNYSRYLSNVELTSLPCLSKTDFHLIEEYAVLILRQPKYK